MNVEDISLVKPTHEFLMLEPEEALKVTKGGIHLPESAQDKDAAGIVVAISDKLGEMEFVSVGQRVLYSRYSGHDLKCAGKEYKIINYEDVIAIVGREK